MNSVSLNERCAVMNRLYSMIWLCINISTGVVSSTIPDKIVLWEYTLQILLPCRHIMEKIPIKINLSIT